MVEVGGELLTLCRRFTYREEQFALSEVEGWPLGGPVMAGATQSQSSLCGVLVLRNTEQLPSFFPLPTCLVFLLRVSCVQPFFNPQGNNSTRQLLKIACVLQYKRRGL